MSKVVRKESRRIFEWRKRCINCGILQNLQGKPKYNVSQASSSMVDILRTWISPTPLPLDGMICNGCFEILGNKVNTMFEGSVLPEPDYGHKKVCFPCGMSTLRVRNHPTPPDCPETIYLMRSIPIHLASRMEHVCIACWALARRHLKRGKNTESSVDCDSSLLEPPNLSTRTPNLLPRTQKKVRRKIRSSIYRRAANNPTHCIFVNCLNCERLPIPPLIKELLLHQYKFYVPDGARVCQNHLDNGRWSELTSQRRDFTGRQFDKIMDMMQRVATYQFDFSNMATLPTHLCYYWLGMSLEEFYDTLNSFPDLAEHVPDPSVALCIYFVKLRTGDSNDRLSTLFNKHKSTIERSLKIVGDFMENRSQTNGI